MTAAWLHSPTGLAADLAAHRDPDAEAAMAALGETDLHVYRHTGTGVFA